MWLGTMRRSLEGRRWPRIATIRLRKAVSSLASSYLTLSHWECVDRFWSDKMKRNVQRVVPEMHPTGVCCTTKVLQERE